VFNKVCIVDPVACRHTYNKHARRRCCSDYCWKLIKLGVLAKNIYEKKYKFFIFFFFFFLWLVRPKNNSQTENILCLIEKISLVSKNDFHFKIYKLFFEFKFFILNPSCYWRPFFAITHFSYNPTPFFLKKWSIKLTIKSEYPLPWSINHVLLCHHSIYKIKYICSESYVYMFITWSLDFMTRAFQLYLRMHALVPFFYTRETKA
jgi:hypothetical protein